MKINIQAPWEVNDYLRKVITEKVEKLTAYGTEILHADVFLKNGTHTGVDDKLVEIRLRLRGPELFAQAYADTFEKSVAHTVDKIKKQLLRKKELQQEKR